MNLVTTQKVKKLTDKAIKQMIREEQEKVEDIEKKGVGPVGMRVTEKPKIKTSAKDFYT